MAMKLYATVKMTTSCQICEMTYTAYCNKYCDKGHSYCNAFLYARRRWDVFWDHLWRANGGGGGGGKHERAARPAFCPEHISKNYTSYGYEILWVDRSHQGGVQCP